MNNPVVRHPCADCGVERSRGAKRCLSCSKAAMAAAQKLACIDRDTLMEHISYDPLTGVLIWKTTNNMRQAGAVATHTNAEGYLQLRLFGRDYRAHRLAWLYVHGEWPDGQIDHINGDRADNRIDNLRVVNHQQNQANRRTFNASRTSRFRGVQRKRTKWVAQIRVNQKTRHIGVFDCEEDASAAYERVAAEIFGHHFARSTEPGARDNDVGGGA